MFLKLLFLLRHEDAGCKQPYEGILKKKNSLILFNLAVSLEPNSWIVSQSPPLISIRSRVTPYQTLQPPPPKNKLPKRLTVDNFYGGSLIKYTTIA